MRERDREQAELLDRYWLVLQEDSAAEPTETVEPDIATTARMLVRELGPPTPDTAFAAQLRARLTAASMPATKPRNGLARPGRASWLRLRPLVRQPSTWLVAGLPSAAVVLLGFVGILTWASRPQTVSAEEVMEKARAVATVVADGGVRSFVVSMVTQSRQENSPSRPGFGFTAEKQIRTESTRWFEAPHRWRVDTRGSVLGADGQELRDQAWQRINVSDGDDVWIYDLPQKTLQVHHVEPTMDGKGEVARFGQDASTLETVVEQASRCGTPVLKGTETVVGRPTYVLDLGVSKCPSVRLLTSTGLPPFGWTRTRSSY
jgi:hypothetical protein